MIDFSRSATNPQLKGRLKDAIVAFSLANLLLLRIWVILLVPSQAQYFARVPHNRPDYLAALLNVFLLGSLIYTGARAGRRCGPKWIRASVKFTFLVSLLVPLDQVRRSLDWNLGAISNLGWPLLVTSACFCIYVLWRFQDWLAATAYRLCLGAAAALMITGFSTIRWIAWGQTEQPVAPIQFPPREKGTPNLRVIWVVFDEWDQRVSFEARPSDLALPNLDRLARTSILATNAYPPSGTTMLSLPALLSGQVLQEVRSTSDHDLTIRGSDLPAAIQFSKSGHLVQSALAMGFRVGVAGWYHPYGRLFGNSPNLWVDWAAFPSHKIFSRRVALTALLAQLRYVFLPFAYSRDVHLEVAREQILTYQGLRQSGLKLVSDPEVDLVFLHLPIPHAPGIYNRYTGEFDPRIKKIPASYFGSLVLLDHTIRDLRQALDASGSGNRTALILSSDHWWRRSVMYDGQLDHRVPFLVHLPGDQTQTTYSNAFNTVVVKNLILGLLNGDLRTQPDVFRLLDAKRATNDFRYSPTGFLFPPATAKSTEP